MLIHTTNKISDENSIIGLVNTYIYKVLLQNYKIKRLLKGKV